MQAKLGNGVIVAGRVTKDAEMKYVGGSSTPMTTFSMAVGKDGETTIFANCKAWRELAMMASDIRKGDSVCAIGTVEEYTGTNGKTYKSVVCEWFGNASFATSLAK